MNVAFLSLGGNLGNRAENLNKALRELERLCGKILKKSTVFETEPWGTKSSNSYYNMAVKLSTALGAMELLEKLLIIETKLGRKRTAKKYSDRIIDIDLLLFNNLVTHSKQLQLPHPRLTERKFVLKPLTQIAPKLVHPLNKKTITELEKICSDKNAVKPVKTAPSLNYICIEGNIGAGKTTLSKVLSKKLDAFCINENFEENQLLSLFYKKPKTFSFLLEYSFLISRFHQISLALKESEKLIISDFSFYKSLWFAKVNLGPKEFEKFSKTFKILKKELPEPDLTIFLSTSNNNLKQNIKRRGRIYEENIEDKYLKKIGKIYKSSIRGSAKKVLELKIKKYDLTNENTILTVIEKYIKDNFGYEKLNH
jgi:deoxyguanosine kinase